MEATDLLHNWLDAKSRAPIWRLVTSTEVAYTLRRQSCGPSSFAFVKFSCEPSDSLSFHSTANWPSVLQAEEIAGVEHAVSVGVVEAFATADYSMSKVCKVTLRSIEWDEIGSSEYAFYLAAKAAISSLTADRNKWALKPLAA